MLLKKLIKDTSKNYRNVAISGLAVDSKKIKGLYFFAIKGNKTNGENYIKEAVKKGASVTRFQKQCKFKR